MSATTSSASAAIVQQHQRGSISSRRSHSYHAAQPQPQRSQSASARSYSYTRPPPQQQPPQPQHPPINHLPHRRDYDTANVARPTYSRRSSSHDRTPRERSYAAVPPTRTQSTRSTATTHRSSSRSGRQRYASNMSEATTVVANGGSTPVRTPGGATDRNDKSMHGGGSKPRRTTINAKTGQWVLGRTIGAGSMGKVKLAKRVEGGEQV